MQTSEDLLGLYFARGWWATRRILIVDSERVAMRSTVSIFAIAVVQILGGLLISFYAGIVLLGTIAQNRSEAAAGYAAHNSSAILFGVFFGALPLSFGVLNVINGIALFRARTWAWMLTLFLSTVPVIGCGVLIVLNPVLVFPRPKPNEQYAMLTVGSGLEYAIYLYLFLFLLLVSVWWLWVMTRPGVRAALGQRSAESMSSQKPIFNRSWFLASALLAGGIVLAALIVTIRAFLRG